MKKNNLQFHLRRLAEEAIPPAEVDLWPAIRARFEASKASIPGEAASPVNYRRANMMKAISGFARSAAWILAAVCLIALVSWAARGLVFQPGAATTYPGPTDEKVIAPVITVTLPATKQSAPTLEMPTPTPLPSSTSGLLPGVSLRLETTFPASPAEANVYTQQVAQPLTVENIKAIAAQLGVQGGIYTAPSEGSGMVYVASDGRHSITFVETASYYSYTDYYALMDQNGAPPFEEQKVIAEAFLKEHGLADFPYTFESLDNNYGTLRVVPLLDGRPVRHGTFDGPHIDLRINRRGQVSGLDYAWPGAAPVGSFPILSAEEAWQKVLEGAAHGISAAWLPEAPRTLQTWLRTYPLGQRVELYGYFGRPLQPVQAGVDPLVTFANLPVRGEKLAAFLQTFRVADFVQITGQVQEDENGNRFFQLESWQLSPYPDVTRSGVIRRQGEVVTLESEGQSLLLPDVPAEVPDGLQVETRGVVIDGSQPTFDWSFIQAGAPGEFGNLVTQTFADLDLNAGPKPSPTPLPEGERPGDRVEGLEVTVYIQPDGIGLLTLDESRWFYAQAPYPEGLASLNNLPVRAWGVAGDLINGQPSIRIDRYEEVYPGLRMQAWLGAWQQTQIEGQQVLLFTAQDSTLADVPAGTQYILFSPPLATGGPEVHGGVGLPGNVVIYEGLVVPGQQFGGYPVIHVYSGAIENGRQNLDGYAIATPEPISAGMDSTPGLPQGEVVIDNIELIYFTTDSRGGPRSPDDPPIYVQPAWRFVGHYADGTKLEILVQALREEYLN